MRIVVVGDGVAARAFLLALSRRPPASCRVQLVHVVRPSPLFPHRATSCMSELYTGLWTSALRGLDRLGVYRSSLFQPVVQTRYCAVDGSELASPRRGLVPFSASSSAAAASLSFIKNADLLNSLAILPGLQTVQGLVHRVSFCRGIDGRIVAHVASAESETQSIPCDMMVVCDGAFSPTKAVVFNQQQQPSPPSPLPLVHRGYRVFRGHTSQRIHDYGFQTWGPRARFASVPTREGNAWFAAVSVRSTPPVLPPPARESSVSNSIPDGPLLNASQYALESDVAFIADMFSSWHAPIPSLLTASCSSSGSSNNPIHSSVVVSEAVASPRPSLLSFGARQASRNAAPGVVFLGDANHTLDPILAQGAGLAIEEGVKLAEALVLAADEKSNASHDGAAVVDRTVASFQAARDARILRLSILSDLSQWVGHLDDAALVAARDRFMLAVPPSIKGLTFDMLIQCSIR